MVTILIAYRLSEPINHFSSLNILLFVSGIMYKVGILSCFSEVVVLLCNVPVISVQLINHRYWSNRLDS